MQTQWNSTFSHRPGMFGSDEVGGFIVHFFDRTKVEHLAGGYEVVDVATFEEGGLSRKLFRVTLRKVAES